MSPLHQQGGASATSTPISIPTDYPPQLTLGAHELQYTTTEKSLSSSPFVFMSPPRQRGGASANSTPFRIAPDYTPQLTLGAHELQNTTTEKSLSSSPFVFMSPCVSRGVVSHFHTISHPARLTHPTHVGGLRRSIQTPQNHHPPLPTKCVFMSPLRQQGGCQSLQHYSASRQTYPPTHVGGSRRSILGNIGHFHDSPPRASNPHSMQY